MSEPPRLRDDGSDPVRALLRHAPRTRAMSPDERDRSRARVARTAAALAAGAGALAILQGAAIGASLGLLTVGAAQILPAWIAPAPVVAPVTRASVPLRAAVRATARPEDEPPAPSASATPAPPAPRPSPRPAPPAPEPAAADTAAPVDTLAQEAALLEKARSTLATSPADALALTQAHAAQFPAGKLGMERELLAIDALRRLGRTGEARTRAEALLSRAQGGLYEPRLRQLLDGLR
jgi:hypothetical protein